MSRVILDTEMIGEEIKDFPFAKVQLTEKERTVGALLDMMALDPKHVVVLADGVRMQESDVIRQDQDIVVMRLIAGG